MPSTGAGGISNQDLVHISPTGVYSSGKIGLGKFYGFPNPVDLLTVGGDIALYPTDPLAERRILGRTEVGAVGLYSATTNPDGTAFRLYGMNHATFQGMIEMMAWAKNSLSPGAGHLFSTYNLASSAKYTRMVISRTGLIGIGADINVTTLNAADRLTVNNSICLASDADADVRTVRARTSAGQLAVFSGSAANDGASIQLLGKTHATLPGRLQFTSYGTAGRGFQFYSYNPTGGAVTENLGLDRDGKIHLSGTLSYDLVPLATTARKIEGKTTTGAIQIFANDATNNGPVVEMFGSSNAGNPGEVHFVTHGATATKGFTLFSYNPATNFWQEMVNIRKDGKVLIGPANMTAPGNYSLYVQNGILTERVKVALQSTSAWADYVFQPGYELMELKDVAAYIGQNKHLPGVPSADEVVANGLDMATTDAMLLKKIEELTLYILEQDKQLKAQGKAIEAMQDAVNESK